MVEYYDRIHIPWWIKVLAGVGIGGVILYKTPLLELFSMFLWVVIIPLLFLGSLGLVSDGMVHAFTGGIPQVQKWAQAQMKKVQKYKEEIQTAEAVEQ